MSTRSSTCSQLRFDFTCSQSRTNCGTCVHVDKTTCSDLTLWLSTCLLSPKLQWTTCFALQSYLTLVFPLPQSQVRTPTHTHQSTWLKVNLTVDRKFSATFKVKSHWIWNKTLSNFIGWTSERHLNCSNSIFQLLCSHGIIETIWVCIFLHTPLGIFIIVTVRAKRLFP